MLTWQCLHRHSGDMADDEPVLRPGQKAFIDWFETSVAPICILRGDVAVGKSFIAYYAGRHFPGVEVVDEAPGDHVRDALLPLYSNDDYEELMKDAATGRKRVIIVTNTETTIGHDGNAVGRLLTWDTCVDDPRIERVFSKGVRHTDPLALGA